MYIGPPGGMNFFFTKTKMQTSAPKFMMFVDEKKIDKKKNPFKEFKGKIITLDVVM